MIYSQTPLHNGPVRVSIKADGDGATLTFLDTQWSTVLSVPPSYLHSLHLFFFFFFFPRSYLNYSPLRTPTEMHTCEFSPGPPSSSSSSPLLSLTLLTHQRFPADILSVHPTLDPGTAEQTHNVTNRLDGALLVGAHVFSVPSDSAWDLAPTSCAWLLL